MDEVKQSAQISLTAFNIRTQFAVNADRRIAYRTLGTGQPLILCNRLRGILDSWDPLFLDELAREFQVIIFDYSGIGNSAGSLPVKIEDVASDIGFLADKLNLTAFILGGWSYGGLVAQTYATRYPERITHLILLGTNPPGLNAHALEPVFIEATLHQENDLDDEIILFFEPASEFSRLAAKKSIDRIASREIDRDIPVPEEVWGNYFEGAKDFASDAFGAREKLGTINVPILAISGDHDPACPIENWYALSRKIPNLQLIMMGQTGHGPHHQYPELASGYISNFIRSAGIQSYL